MYVRVGEEEKTGWVIESEVGWWSSSECQRVWLEIDIQQAVGFLFRHAVLRQANSGNANVMLVLLGY